MGRIGRESEKWPKTDSKHRRQEAQVKPRYGQNLKPQAISATVSTSHYCCAVCHIVHGISPSPSSSQVFEARKLVSGGHASGSRQTPRCSAIGDRKGYWGFGYAEGSFCFHFSWLYWLRKIRQFACRA